MLHHLISSRLLLLTFTGLKSGKCYTIPVGYLREEKMVTIVTKRFRAWWRNFQEPAPVEVRIEGKRYQCEAKTLTDETTIVPVLTEVMTKHPDDAAFFGVRFVSPGKPDMDDIRRVAPKLVVVQVRLTP